MNKIYIMDTNILSFMLGIKKSPNSQLIIEDVYKKIEEISNNKETIAVPLPVIVETGNQLSNELTGDKRIEVCKKFIDIIEYKFDGKSPWHSFEEQKIFWEEETLKKILRNWEKYIVHGINFGDFLIIALYDYYKEKYSCEVELWTEDKRMVEAYKDIGLEDMPKRREVSIKRKRRN